MYRAKWTPHACGPHQLQVMLDGQLHGPSCFVQVQPTPEGSTESMSVSHKRHVEVSSVAARKKLVNMKADSRGVRIRVQPSLLSAQVSFLLKANCGNLVKLGS